MGKYDDDEGGYFCELLKEGLTERDMSGLERGWFIGVGLIGAVVADPVLWITRKLGIKGGTAGLRSGRSHASVQSELLNSVKVKALLHFCRQGFCFLLSFSPIALKQ